MIKKIEKFTFEGAEYTSLQAVKECIENRLGATLDKMSNSLSLPLSSKQKLELFDQIVKNRDAIIKLLSVEYDKSDRWEYEDLRNILDL